MNQASTTPISFGVIQKTDNDKFQVYRANGAVRMKVRDLTPKQLLIQYKGTAH